MKLKQPETVALVLKLNAQKEVLQKRFDDGLKVTDLAVELNVSVHTLRGILPSIGINYEAKGKLQSQQEQIVTLHKAILVMAEAVRVVLPSANLEPVFVLLGNPTGPDELPGLAK